jgi:HPt (histidine-containing phosphotransfer) domain-containing protein
MLIGIFIKNTESLLEEMHQMIREDNMQGIADAAHAIKGSVGNLKLDEIFELSKGIELMAKTMKNEDENNKDNTREENE